MRNSTTRAPAPAPARVVVIGGGVAGLTAVRRLERLFRASDAEIVLVSRDDFLTMTPLLFEAFSGAIELRHCAQPIRPCLDRARFVEATVESVDLERQVVHAMAMTGRDLEVPYDQLVVALGATTDMTRIQGARHAFTFRTAADALLLRSHIIERFERADVESDPRRREQLLTFVVIGGGLVGVELLGELTAFAGDLLRHYPYTPRSAVHFHLFEAGDHLIPESTRHLADYGARTLRALGAELHTSCAVSAIEPGQLRVGDRVIEADTIVLAADIVPSPIAARIGVERDRRGGILTGATMRSVSHPAVWAIGDCAAILGPEGGPHPALAQHAIREGRAVARNVLAAALGHRPRALVYRSPGKMASFGRRCVVVDLGVLHVTGFLAWWLRRTYYLLQMPRWGRRLRTALDWTISLLFHPHLTRIDHAVQREQELRNMPRGARSDASPDSELPGATRPELIVEIEATAVL